VPLMRLKSVVFPAPLGPMMMRRSPAATVRVTRFAAVTPPNRLVTPTSCRQGSAPPVLIPQSSRLPHSGGREPASTQAVASASAASGSTSPPRPNQRAAAPRHTEASPPGAKRTMIT